tara:strand:+ start:695 stop:2545 length:1851 start_codon:yes stop_codon:yes gene_type:complete
MKKIIVTVYMILLCLLNGQPKDSILTYIQHFDLALDHFSKGRYQLAENEFKNILIEKRNFDDPVSHFMLAKTQFNQNKEIDCERTCNSYINKYPNSRYEVNVRMLLSDILILKEKYSQALEQLLPLKISIEDSLLNSHLDYRILNIIMNGISPNKLEKLLFYNEDDVIKNILNLAISYRSILDGRMNDMELSLSVIDIDILPSYYHNFYESLSRFIGKESTLHGTIAVILPLSGEEEKKGKTYLSGLSRMVNDFQFDLSTSFKIYDNKSSDIITLKILNSLKLDKKIIAILGYFSEISNLTSASFSGPIPIMLSKSNYSELTILSENIYLLSTSSEIQAKLSARYAVNILGFKSIAVLSSADDVNKNYADYFIEELNQLGIDPVSTQWFYGKPENLSKQFSAIRAKAWSLVPQKDPNLQYLDLEIDSLDALFDVDVADFMDPVEDVNNNKMTKRDSLKVNLNTIEAIYIPIDKKDLSYIGTQLPMYNLSTKIIGNESWMDIDVLSQDIIGPHLQGLTVLSSEYPKFGMTETSELDRIFSMGYDHGYFVNSLIKQSSNSRRRYKNLLKEGDLFMGASSLIELAGPNKNENQIVRVLEYNKNKMGTVGYYNGKSLVEN